MALQAANTTVNGTDLNTTAIYDTAETTMTSLVNLTVNVTQSTGDSCPNTTGIKLSDPVKEFWE